MVLLRVLILVWGLFGLKGLAHAKSGFRLAMACGSGLGDQLVLDVVSTGEINHGYSFDREMMNGTLTIGARAVPVSVGYVIYSAGDGSVEQVQASLVGHTKIVLVGEVEGRSVFYGLDGAHEIAVMCERL